MSELNEVLEAWDRGEEVTSISMGGLGDAYEQCIQNMTFELIRHFNGKIDWDKLESEKDLPRDERTYLKELDSKLDKIIAIENQKLGGGFSGAQVGAAKNLALAYIRQGYDAVMEDDDVAERHIQVQKRAPVVMTSAEALQAGIEAGEKMREEAEEDEEEVT